MPYALESGNQDAIGNITTSIGDSPNLDAFSRLRVSDPDTIFDSTFRWDLQPLVYYTSTANGGTVTHSAANASALLSLDGTAGGSAIIQSRAYHHYIPGKSQLILMTEVVGTAVAGVTKRVGYFDANDGVFLEQNGTTDVAFVRRTSTSGSPINNRVVQASWNLDPLNGTGKSGILLDLSKGQVMVIDFQWLGMGRVRIGFDIDGVIVYAHEFRNANNLTTVYMLSGSRPVRWEISGDAVATMLATCASVQSEGGRDKHLGYQFSYSRASVTAGDGTQTYAFSIRPKATFNSIPNRFPLVLLSSHCLVTGNAPVLVEIYFDTAVGGTPSWGDMNATYSGLQVDTAGTPSGGVKVSEYFVAATTQSKGDVSQDFTSRYPLTLDIAGTGYTNMTFYVTGQGANSACRPGLIWEEVR